jgi:hypothetical protein
MNVRLLFLVLALTSPLGALATPPASTTTLTVDCDQPAWPTLREFAEHYGFDAYDPAYRVRQRVIIDALRACRRGADRVQLVLDPGPTAPSMLAQRKP